MVNLGFGEFDGNLWEDLCQKCFKYKYVDNGYQRIPADDGGDMGIEGFTRDGLVFQCYCPNKDYPPKDLYEFQRDKITEDLKKLIKNKNKLIKSYLHTTKIRVWYFVTPYYNSKELVEHCISKALEYRQKNLEHLAPDFDIRILESSDFSIEINHLLRVEKNLKLNFQVNYQKNNKNWNQCTSTHVKNLIRKITAIVPNSDTEPGKNRVDRIVQIYMDYYLKGFKLLNLLQSQYLDLYEKLIRLRSTYESGVEVKCNLSMLGTESNTLLFTNITDEFGSVLKSEFNDLFQTEMIEGLKNQILSSWLLECPMDFR